MVFLEGDMQFKARVIKILSICVLVTIIGVVAGLVVRWFPLLSDGAVFLLAIVFLACCLVLLGGLIKVLFLFFLWLYHRLK
jgi:hypothetical protein